MIVREGVNDYNGNCRGSQTAEHNIAMIPTHEALYRVLGGDFAEMLKLQSSRERF